MAQRNTWEVSDGQHTTDVNVSEKIVICKRKEVPGITLTIGMFFDGTGNNVFNTDKRLLETCTSLDVGMKTEDAASCVEKLGKSDLRADKDSILTYSFRVTQTNDKNSPICNNVCSNNKSICSN